MGDAAILAAGIGVCSGLCIVTCVISAACHDPRGTYECMCARTAGVPTSCCSSVCCSTSGARCFARSVPAASIAILPPMSPTPLPLPVQVLVVASNAVVANPNNPTGYDVNPNRVTVNFINEAHNNVPSTGSAKGGTRRKGRRSKRQRGGVPTPSIPIMTLALLQSIFDEVMTTVAPKFTGLNIADIYLEIQEIVNKLFFKI